MTAIVLSSVLASVSAILAWWVLTVIFTQLSMILTVLMILIVTRYLARTTRTEASNARKDRRKTASAVELLCELVDEYARSSRSAQDELRDVQRSIQTAIENLEGSTKTSVTILDDRLNELEALLQKTSRSSSRHVTSSVRDSTRQIEALTQIYSRFPEFKLPMPSTGGFAIDSQALAHLIALVEEREPKRILELGSGTSTIWLGYLAKRYGGKVVTLDHLEEYLNLTRTAVTRHDLVGQVECRFAPLEKVDVDGELYPWYSLHAFEGLNNIDLVVIDGPPAATGPKARYPALPNIVKLLAPNTTVILDDAHRQDEIDIVDAWLSKFSDFEQIEGGTSRLAVLERDDSSHQFDVNSASSRMNSTKLEP